MLSLIKACSASTEHGAGGTDYVVELSFIGSVSAKKVNVRGVAHSGCGSLCNLKHEKGISPGTVSITGTVDIGHCVSSSV